MKTEIKKPKAETDDSVTYDGKYKDQIIFINYKFKDDKLYRGGVVYAQKMDSADIYMKNYEEIKKEIIAAYGKPVIDGEKQTVPGAVIDPGKKAEAACKGELMYAAQWNLPRSMVIFTMSGNGKDCVTSLIYLDRNALHSIAEQDGSGGIDVIK